MELFASLAFSTFLAAVYCAPFPQNEVLAPPRQDVQHHLVDGVDLAQLPIRFQNIAVMCELFRKLNAINGSPTNDFGIVPEKNTPADVQLKDFPTKEIENGKDTTGMNTNSGIDSRDYLENSNSKLVSGIEDWLQARTANVQHNEQLTDVVDHSTGQLRDKRSSVNNVPAELAKLFQGVCLTDECLAVLREYLKWRKENGYPVYTGVTQIGK